MFVEQPDPETDRQRATLREHWRASGWHRGVNVIDVIHERAVRPGDEIRFVAPDHSGAITLERLFDEGGRLASVLLDSGVRP
jgi:hypothetical protein